MLCGQCLLCFYILSLSESDSFGFALGLFQSAWIEHCSPGPMELGFSLTPLSRGLSSLCRHLRVQYFIVVHRVENFHRVSHLVFSFCWCFGVLDH